MGVAALTPIILAHEQARDHHRLEPPRAAHAAQVHLLAVEQGEAGISGDGAGADRSGAEGQAAVELERFAEGPRAGTKAHLPRAVGALADEIEPPVAVQVDQRDLCVLRDPRGRLQRLQVAPVGVDTEAIGAAGPAGRAGRRFVGGQAEPVAGAEGVGLAAAEQAVWRLSQGRVRITQLAGLDEAVAAAIREDLGQLAASGAQAEQGEELNSLPGHQGPSSCSPGGRAVYAA